MKDLKHGVLLYAPCKMFFNTNVRLSSLITFDLALCLFIAFLFFVRNQKATSCFNFPLGRYFVFYSICFIFGCLYPVYAPNQIPRIVISILIYCYIYFYCIETKNDLYFAIWSYIGFSFVLCGNGLLQTLFEINPLDDYIQSISFEGLSEFSSNDLSRYMENVRVRSFIPHAISYGICCVSMLFLTLVVFILDKRFLRPIQITLISIVLLLIGILSCGSRTPILGLFPLFIYTKQFLGFAKSNKTLSIICLFIFGYFFYDYIIYSIMSILDQDIAAEAGGSDTELRTYQLAVALNFFIQSPIWGNGITFDVSKHAFDVGGMESVWFPLLTNSGIIGIVGYLSLYLGLLKVSLHMNNRWLLIGFVLSWLLMRTATSLMGIGDTILLTIFIIMYKMELIVNENN